MLQIPNTKIQIIKKSEIPILKAIRAEVYDLRHWNLFGA